MCNHAKNFEIIEVMRATHLRRAVSGNPDGLNAYGKPIGYNEVGDIQYCIFRCNDCKAERRFPSLAAEKPIFIKKAIDILFP